MSYQSKKDDTEIIAKLEKVAELHPREGFWKCYFRIRNKGGEVNHKRLYRIYKELGLQLRRKHKKRLPNRVKEPLEVPQSFTHTWSIDFMSDATQSTRKFRTFNVIDDYNREVLFIETDYSIKSSRVIWILRHLANKYGKPKRIRMDNGPEFIAKIAQEWSKVHEVEFKYIEPGKPTQNAYIERFNRSYREGVLDLYVFDNIDQVRDITAEWVYDFNHHRPHEALGNLSPVTYRLKKDKNKNLLNQACSASATPSLHKPDLKPNQSNKNVYF